MKSSSERVKTAESSVVSIGKLNGIADAIRAEGVYHFTCYDEFGNLKWEDDVENVVTNVGKNALLDNGFNGSGFTQVGPYMGLISSAGWTNLATTLSALVSYTSGTGATSLTTAAAHGLLPGDTFILTSVVGTGTNVALLSGTWQATTGTTGSTLNFTAAPGMTVTTVTGGTVTTTSGTRINDTMVTHGNWTEAGTTNAPTFTARGTPAWSASAAGVKATSSATIDVSTTACCS